MAEGDGAPLVNILNLLPEMRQAVPLRETARTNTTELPIGRAVPLREPELPIGRAVPLREPATPRPSSFADASNIDPRRDVDTGSGTGTNIDPARDRATPATPGASEQRGTPLWVWIAGAVAVGLAVGYWQKSRKGDE